MVKKYSKKSPKKKIILIILFVLLIAAIVGAVFSARQKEDPVKTLPNGTVINLAPPTETEKKETEAHKNTIAESKDTTQTSSGQKAIVITSATQNPRQQFEVHAFVAGVSEDEGTCTLTATKTGSQTVTKTSVGAADVSNTSCAHFIPVADFPGSGTWSITLTYNSPSTTASSAAKQVTITK